MPQQKLGKKHPKEPPLEMAEIVEIDPQTGATTRVVRHRRGVLVRETREYSSAEQWARELSETPRDTFNAWCEATRNLLEESGIPSDRQRLWYRNENGDWTPRTQVTKDEISKPGTAVALWYARMKAMTEALSVERAAGDLLWELTRMLERPDIDKHLWNIGQVLRTYSTLRITGINLLAAEGLTARRSRAKGPAKKRERAAAICDIIGQQAEEYWFQFPLYKGDASNTAYQIAPQVNQRLRERGLLSSTNADLQPKTIADYIRAARRGNPC